MTSIAKIEKAKQRRAKRVRSVVRGTPERPRLTVFRSNRGMWAQIVDDQSGRTLASACSRHVDETALPKKDMAAKVGELLAERAKAAGVGSVVFDRGSYLYHGRVKALADGARQGGLEF